MALDRDTECRYAFVLDLTAQRAGRGARWYLEQYNHGIRDACRFNFSTQTIPLLWGLETTVAPPSCSRVWVRWRSGHGLSGSRRPADYRHRDRNRRDDHDPRGLRRNLHAYERGRTNFLGHWRLYRNRPERRVAPDHEHRILPGGGAARHWQLWREQRLPDHRGLGNDDYLYPRSPGRGAAGATYIIGGIPNAIYKTPLMGFGVPVEEEGWPCDDGVSARRANYTIGYGVSKDRRGMDEVGTTASEDRYVKTAGSPFISVDMGGNWRRTAASAPRTPGGGGPSTMCNSSSTAPGLTNPRLWII